MVEPDGRGLPYGLKTVAQFQSAIASDRRKRGNLIHLKRHYEIASIASLSRNDLLARSLKKEQDKIAKGSGDRAWTNA
jgi:hypothetical protein